MECEHGLHLPNLHSQRSRLNKESLAAFPRRNIYYFQDWMSAQSSMNPLLHIRRHLEDELPMIYLCLCRYFLQSMAIIKNNNTIKRKVTLKIIAGERAIHTSGFAVRQQSQFRRQRNGIRTKDAYQYYSQALHTAVFSTHKLYIAEDFEMNCQRSEYQQS